MSGGHWGYLEMKIEDAAEGADRGRHALLLLAAIERELDWGYSGDTCPKCAELRTIAALQAYYGGNAYGSQAAVAIVRDRRQNLCPEDIAREAARKAVPA